MLLSEDWLGIMQPHDEAFARNFSFPRRYCEVNLPEMENIRKILFNKQQRTIKENQGLRYQDSSIDKEIEAVNLLCTIFSDGQTREFPQFVTASLLVRHLRYIRLSNAMVIETTKTKLEKLEKKAEHSSTDLNNIADMKQIIETFEHEILQYKGIKPPDVYSDILESMQNATSATNIILTQKQHVFEKDDFYKFHSTFRELFKQVQKSILIIDNYINDEIFDYCLYVNDIENLKSIKILSSLQAKNASKLLPFSAKKFNAEYDKVSLEVRSTSAFHDRYLLIDETQLWLLGASPKDGGKKGTSIVKLEGKAFDDENQIINQEWEKADPIFKSTGSV